MNLKWQRPESVAFPKIWLEFSIKNSDTSDKSSSSSSTEVNYRIQDLPVHRFDDAIQHMCDNFMCEEPILLSKEVYRDEISTKMLKKFWFEILSQHVSLVCFREGSDEIVGINFLIVTSRDDESWVALYDDGAAMRDYVRVWEFLKTYNSIFDLHDVDFYLAALGLGVAKEYRKRGIAAEMLKARVPLARALGLQVTSTAFTSIGSQIPAERVGFQTDHEIDYRTLTNLGYGCAGVKMKSIKQMTLFV